MDLEQLQPAFPNFQAPNIQGHGTPLEVEPLSQIPRFPPTWEEEHEEEAYWEEMLDVERHFAVNVPPAPRPTNGVLGLPIGPNLRVTAPPTPTIFLIVDDDEASYTASSDALNDSDNNLALPPPIPISENVINLSEAVGRGCSNPKFENIIIYGAKIFLNKYY